MGGTTRGEGLGEEGGVEKGEEEEVGLKFAGLEE